MFQKWWWWWWWWWWSSSASSASSASSFQQKIKHMNQNRRIQNPNLQIQGSSTFSVGPQLSARKSQLIHGAYHLPLKDGKRIPRRLGVLETLGVCFRSSNHGIWLPDPCVGEYSRSPETEGSWLSWLKSTQLCNKVVNFCRAPVCLHLHSIGP